MYGLIAIFDETTEELIKNIWKELKDNFISSYAYEVEDRKPHITLASYNNINKKDFIKQMDVTYQNQSVIDIKFNTIGSFLSSGALFFSPTTTKDLIEFHLNHHKDFESFNDNPNSLYLPNNWIPHCTIANRLSQEKLNQAFDYCSKRHRTIRGKIVEVVLIDVSDKDKAPIIYSKELKK
ncbi:2'-5' RNA ligase family protein [Oceanobacillus bengalensis]|uniref:2'-5' RNA ligase family protein n=1 Tax=Oceanobacillus bengalensis TaxID=1435466 RepID=A0A494Z400_9BACI|nr:2'-5' RNA ligase family protein [Oceanobacillus bengalensis]RKQ17171.1 2'-5' RNA ligase family protein [Oceanobacillus bengalensis]